METNRNFAVDWLKGWMIISIVIYHSFFLAGFRGYLAVDVFFFLSGYFLMLSFLKKPTTAVQYTWGRIKVLAIPFIICLLVSCLFRYHLFSGFDSFDSAIEQYGRFFFALPFAEEFGGEVTRNNFLLGSWFLSVLVIASFLLYGLLQFNHRLAVLVVFPAIVLLGYNAMMLQSDTVDGWVTIGVLSIRLVRGLVEMAAGALICFIYLEHKSGVERRAVLINIIGIIASFFLVSMMFAKQSLDKFFVVVIPWIVLSVVIEGSWLKKVLGWMGNRSMVAWIGRYTLYVYCAHGPVELFVYWANDHLFHRSLHGGLLLSVYLVTLAIASILLFRLCRVVKKANNVC